MESCDRSGAGRRRRLALLALVAASFLAARAPAEELVRHVGDAPLEVRLEPQAGPVLGTVEPDDVVSVWERDGSDLVVILPDGVVGWVHLSPRERRRVLRRVRPSEDRGWALVEPPDAAIRAEPPSRFFDAGLPPSPVRIVVSLEGLTLRVSAPSLGIEEVHPIGVGTLNRTGRSITPTCASMGVESFYTHRDPDNTWYYMARRWEPAYFGGFPFIRLDIRNRYGRHTYGIHGPISKRADGTWYLRRGYVSHGCIRMKQADLQRVFALVRRHPNTRVFIQQEPDRRKDGAVVDVEHPRWPPGAGGVPEEGRAGQ